VPKNNHFLARIAKVGLAANLHKLGNMLQEKAREQCKELQKAA
jgi:hypothetical protein